MDTPPEEVFNLKEEEYKLLFSNMLDAFALHKIIKDNRAKPIDYEFVEVNSAFEKILGLKRKDIIGKRVTELLPGIEKDPANWIGKYSEVASFGKPIQFESYSDTLKKWFNVSAYSPKKGYFATIFIDITEQKRTNEELQNKIRFSDKLINMSPDIIYIYDIISQKNVYVNNGIQKVLNYSEEELKNMGKNMIAQLMHPDDIKVYLNETFPKYFELKDDEILSHTYRMKHKNGKWYWLKANESIYLRQSDGSAKQIFGTIHNINDTKILEEDLENKELMFKNIFDNINSGIVIYEFLDNGNTLIIKDFNKGAERIENIKKEDVIDKNILDVFPGVIDFGIYDVFKRVWQTGNSENFPVKIYSDNRISGWRENYIFNISNNKIVAVYEDYTEQKKSEELLKSKTALLEAQTNSIDEGILIVDSKGSKLFQNQRCIDLWKIPKELVDNKDDMQQIEFVKHRAKYPDKFVEKVIYLYSHPGDITNDEVEFKDGIILERYSAPILDKEGNIYGRIWTFRDITKRKNIEQELERQNNLLSSFLKNLQIGIFMVSAPSGQPLLANEPALNILGRGIMPAATANNLAEVYKAYKLGTSTSYPINEMPIIQGMNGKITQIDDMEVERPDGTRIRLEIFGSPVKDASGNIWASMVSFVDITERKKSENMLKTKIAELEKFNKMTVDRELKMIELKTRIKELENKLSKQN